jgi:hypothetical protein
MNSLAASAMLVAGEVRLKIEEEEEVEVGEGVEGVNANIVVLACLWSWSKAGVVTTSLAGAEAFTGVHGVEGAILPGFDCSTESTSQLITSDTASCIVAFLLSMFRAVEHWRKSLNSSQPR